MRNGSFAQQKRNSNEGNEKRTNIMLDIGLKQSLQRLSNKTKMSLSDLINQNYQVHFQLKNALAKSLNG